jgi:oligopeptide/dipeptide ABC transporter ATP-binding protein
MGVVSEMADRVVVYYAGQVVETGAADRVLLHPRHPYTAALFRSVPSPTTDRALPLVAIPGTVPHPRNFPAGCRFHPRCELVFGRCRDEAVPLFALEGGTRHSRCWLAEGGDDAVAPRLSRDALVEVSP